MAPRVVEAAPEAEFYFPYFLHTPDVVRRGEPVRILVESTSIGAPTDEFGTVRSDAERRVRQGFGRAVADELGVPFLHPVFPRPVTEPVDWTHYTHSLDRETLQIEEPPLARIDRQLLAMVADARERLADEGVETGERFLLNGFSASGTFANRFAALHPDRVVSVSAGGINGMAILPIEGVDVPIVEVEEVPAKYPVGIADVETLTGTPFDLAAFRRVHQLLYLGADDDNDALLYPDAWTDPEVRAAAVFAYGEDVHRDRFPRCHAIYEEANLPAIFSVYEDTGHEPGPAFDDVVAFHERSLAGDDIRSIRDDLAGTRPGMAEGSGAG